MDPAKIGNLIRQLRKESHMTQMQLAQRMNISDKAVSKWERGLGCPELSLLPELSEILHVDLEKLLSGELDANEIPGGNMRKLRFYVCPTCGNIITAAGDAKVSCCGKKLEPLEPRKAEEKEKLHVEIVEDEFFISADHPMERGHYIPFLALLRSDTVVLRKLYPEWDLQVRLPMNVHGRLFWYCTQHGLFYMEL